MDWDTKTPRTPEPVVVGDLINAAAAVLIAVLWALLPGDALTIIASVVAAVGAAINTSATRARVTPVDQPTAADGAPLIPAGQASEEVSDAE